MANMREGQNLALAVDAAEKSEMQPIGLVSELSDQQQESLSGGYACDCGGGFELFFFQDTAIDTFADNQIAINTGAGGLQATSQSSTGYSFRQTTLAFLSFGGGSGGRSLFNVFGLLRGLFGGLG
jgi:hypothetical protein